MKSSSLHLQVVWTLLITALIGNAADVIRVPNPDAKAISQIAIDKRACGPISQLNAYEFSSEKWRQTTQRIPGDTQQKRFQYLIRHHGHKWSRHIQGRRRWDEKRGINSLDFLDFINDFHAKSKLPQVKLESLFLIEDESHADLLKRTHSCFKQSLKHGLPPIIDLRRFAKKKMAGGHHWRSVFGHFVVVYEIPSKLPKNATSMTIKYIDPWGGQIRTGTLETPKNNFFANDNNKRSGYQLQRSPCLEANFPGCDVGKHTLKPGEENVLILSATLGDF